MIILHDASCAPPRRDSFERISLWVVRSAGGREGFVFAFILILAWVAAGPFFKFHESWTTSFSIVTTSVTFLLVFLIQHAQNREAKAVHLKLDELIYAAKNARNELISIEHLTEDQLDQLSSRYLRLAQRYQNGLMQADSSLLSIPGDRPSLIISDFQRGESSDREPS
jgi:low affinity Fe/Cu permease